MDTDRLDSTHTGEEDFCSPFIQLSTVFDLVHRYLCKIADKGRKDTLRDSACNKFYRQHARRKDIDGRALTNFGHGIGDSSEQSKSHKNIILKTFGISRNSSKECITDYTRAVRDGRKHAKFYVRNAVLYGLQCGLLIPIERHRNMLRVSRELKIFPQKNSKEGKKHYVVQRRQT